MPRKYIFENRCLQNRKKIQSNSEKFPSSFNTNNTNK